MQPHSTHRFACGRLLCFFAWVYIESIYTVIFQLQFRFATKLDVILILIGIVFTFFKSMAFPLLIVVYGEFTTLLVDRTLGVGTSSTTILLPLFGGGKVLYVNLNEVLCNSFNKNFINRFVYLQNKRDGRRKSTSDQKRFSCLRNITGISATVEVNIWYCVCWLFQSFCVTTNH